MALALLTGVDVSEGSEAVGATELFESGELMTEAAVEGEDWGDEVATAVPLPSIPPTVSGDFAVPVVSLRSVDRPLFSRATVLRSLPPRQESICRPAVLSDVREDAFEVDDSVTEFTSSDRVTFSEDVDGDEG